MAEAGVALPAVGVEDPQRRPPAGWAGAVPRDDHLRSLADDVSTEPDPCAPRELETDPGRLADCRRQAGGGARGWLEHHERDAGPTRERREPAESIAESRSRNAGGAIRRSIHARQVDDEHVHRPTREQRAGDRQTLEGFGRGEHHEPFRLHAARHRLDGIERRREVQPGHDRARRLGLRDEPQGQRRPAARDVAADREAHPARDATRTEDRIELGEAGRMDAIEIDRSIRRALVLGLRIGSFERHHCQRPHHLAGEPGRCRTPARPKGRQRRSKVGGRDGHGLSIEQMFE
jgi:hypothetical protein